MTGLRQAPREELTYNQAACSTLAEICGLAELSHLPPLSSVSFAAVSIGQ